VRDPGRSGFGVAASAFHGYRSLRVLFDYPHVIRDQNDLRKIFERKMQERQEFIDRYFVFSDSDWKPPPLFGFEPMFEPALAGDLIAIPAGGGGLSLLDRSTGAVKRQVMPFGTPNPDTYVVGGLAVSDDGAIYYNAVKFDPDHPDQMPSQAWLVAVAPDGTTRTADYAALNPSAPAATASCFGIYDIMATPLPWPPQNPDGSPMMPPSAPCGPQRPGLNATPAVGPDGTIFLATRAHRNPRYSYVLAVKPDLSPKWATSLRDYLKDGCGVTTAIDATADQNMFHCKVGTPMGVERNTGLMPAAHVDDSSSSTPVALPDGGVLYGAFTGYNGSRGHLLKFDRAGAIRASFDFGWDSTPAVHGGADNYKIVIKDNHYGQDENGVDLGPFYITQLDSSLNAEWRFQSSNTMSCARQPDGSKMCEDDHPNGFEWCINAVAVDRDGTVYANSEDGNTYAITAQGKLRDSIFLDSALGAAYTPIALDHSGRVFALNAGHLWVLGTK